MKIAILLLPLAVWRPHAAAQQVHVGGRISAQRQAPQGNPVGEASIEGRVVNEITGEPVKKAQVNLNGPTYRAAVTGASGNFAFRQLPAGQYQLQAHTDFSWQQPGSRPPHVSIAIAADEHKADVVVSLLPGAAIAGRVVDEEGVPMANCNIGTMQWDYSQGTKTLRQGGGAPTNDKGEYRIAPVAPGKYSVLARCYATVPLPHPFIRRGSEVEIPMQGYAPLFYPGNPDVSGASRVVVAAGAEVTGIDFRMLPAGDVTVRGHVAAAGPQTMPGNIQVTLEPRDPLRRQWQRAGAGVNPRTGDFRFQQVQPGPYEIVASTYGDGTAYYARVPLNVGSEPPEPVELRLAPTATLSGTVSFDEDGKVPFENIHVALNPVEQQFPFAQPHGQVQKDGTFVLAGVVPGRWRLSVGGAPGYVKSVSLNDREVSPFLPEIPAGFTGPLRIVIGTKMAAVQGTVTGAPAEAGQIAGLLWPAEPERLPAGLGRTFQLDPQGSFRMEMMAPGQYYACAMAVPEPWSLLQNVTLLGALKGHCAAVEMTEGGRATVQVPFLSARDLEQMTQDAENDTASK